MYCVIAGEKRFTLHPPCDAPFLYERSYPMGSYRLLPDEHRWVVQQEVPSCEHACSTRLFCCVTDVRCVHVAWVSVDPVPSSMASEQYPLYRHGSRLTCAVRPGETLVRRDNDRLQ